MTREPRAQEKMYGEGRPMVIELVYDERDAAATARLTSQIEVALSKGSAVLVRGWEPKPKLDFSVDSIRLYRPTMAQMVDAQGT